MFIRDTQNNHLFILSRFKILFFQELSLQFAHLKLDNCRMKRQANIMQHKRKQMIHYWQAFFTETDRVLLGKCIQLTLSQCNWNLNCLLVKQTCNESCKFIFFIHKHSFIFLANFIARNYLFSVIRFKLYIFGFLIHVQNY